MNNIEKRMNELKPTGLSAGEKERIWSTMEAQLTPHVRFSMLSSMPTLKTLRRVSVPLVVALGLVLGSGATVYAHEVALPGDLLFPVKIHVEKAQIFLAKNAAKKDELRIAFSEKRLNEVRALVAAGAGANANASTTAAASTSMTGTTTAASTTPSTSTKKALRTERAIAAALAELEATKATFAESGSPTGVLILEDIIDELKGVGDGSVTITKISMNGGRNHDKNVKVQATITASSTGTTTATTVTRVKIEERKQGAKIEIKTNILSGLFGKQNKEDKHDVRDEDDEDDDNHKGRKNDDHDDDNDDRNEMDDEKKISICHASEEGTRTISISVHAARAHISHGDTLGACDGGNTTTPDAVAPIMSSVAISANATSGTATWTTNEHSMGEVYLGTSSPVATNRTPDAAHTSYLLAHSLALSPLLPSTTYYYVVVSKDFAGNSATSSIASFTTPPLPIVLDTTAPTISGIAATSIAGTATIGFTTSELATGTVYVGTTNPLQTESASTVSLAASTTHSALFTGLTTATTHYYIVVARDLSQNTATSSQGSFLAL